MRSHTCAAEGGAAGVKTPDDSLEMHFDDTVVGGDWLCDQDVVENFVATELLKLLSFSEIRANLLHFRTSDGKEVDFVLERPDGTLAGVEVKTASRVDHGDFKGLEVLQQVSGDDFVCGVVLYTGHDVVPFGDKLFAVPIAALWQ